MQRFRLSLVCLLLSAWAFAQPELDSSHEVSVHLPELYGIRIVGAGQPAVSPVVTFDYGADVAGYDTAVAGPGYLSASSVTDFSDVQVYVRKNANDFSTWTVQVEATPLSYLGSGSGAGLALSDLSVERGAVSGLTQEAVSFGVVQPRWALSETSQLIVFGGNSTHGWKSLGFNGLDYRVAVDGDEDPGEYATVVTYSIMEP